MGCAVPTVGFGAAVQLLAAGPDRRDRRAPAPRLRPPGGSRPGGRSTLPAFGSGAADPTSRLHPLRPPAWTAEAACWRLQRYLAGSRSPPGLRSGATTCAATRGGTGRGMRTGPPARTPVMEMRVVRRVGERDD